MSRESQAAWKAAGVLLAGVAGITAFIWALVRWPKAAIVGLLLCAAGYGLFLVWEGLRDHFMREDR